MIYSDLFACFVIQNLASSGEIRPKITSPHIKNDHVNIVMIDVLH